jgi:hypothetical protein
MLVAVTRTVLVELLAEPGAWHVTTPEHAARLAAAGTVVIIGPALSAIAPVPAVAVRGQR